jgi:hypothetical protein
MEASQAGSSSQLQASISSGGEGERERGKESKITNNYYPLESIRIICF